MAGLAADDLRTGRLLQLFGTVLANDYSYWLVCPRAVVQRPQAMAFRDWLLQEAQQSRLPPHSGKAA